MNVVIALVVVVLAIYLLSFLGMGLSGVICDSMAWIGSFSPWSGFATWLAFLACFFLVRLLLLPLQLNHTRIDRKTGTSRRWFSTSGDAPFIWCLFGLATADCVLLFIIARALSKGHVSWLTHSPFHWLATVGILALVLIGNMILSAILVHMTTVCFDRLAATLTHRPVRSGGFVNIRDKEEQIEILCGIDVVFYGPVFLLMTVVYGEWPFLVSMLTSCLLTKAIFSGLTNFISRWIDWYHDGVTQKIPQSS